MCSMFLCGKKLLGRALCHSVTHAKYLWDAQKFFPFPLFDFFTFTLWDALCVTL